MIHELLSAGHNLRRRHTRWHKEGIGDFHLCESRLPWGRARVSYQPDFDGPRWWPVPVSDGDEEDGGLLTRMLRADNAHHAMALLRAAEEEEDL